MENTKYGRRREGRWTPIWAKAQDTTANPNSWETHLVRKIWDIGLLRRGVYPPPPPPHRPPGQIPPPPQSHRPSLFYGVRFSVYGETASAEGTMLRLPKARSPSRLGGLGSVVSSPAGSGACRVPETVRILNISCQKKYILGSS